MAKLLTVHVTQADIDKGIPKDPYHCAIARAIEREHPENTGRLRVGGATISLGDTDYFHSDRSMEFVNDFDRGYPVKPSTFRFRPMDYDA